MTPRWILLVTVMFLVACGTSEKPTISLDAKNVTATEDSGPDICTPNCEGRACGPDGCGGNCGTCKMQLESCTDEGQCVPVGCDSSKDCPGNLVCEKDKGVCVICVGDEDCPEGKTCGADNECHEE